MLRGEIWWADIPEGAGSAPAYRRPVLIIQADAFNRSRIATVIGVGLTSNLALADAPGNVSVSRAVSGLPKDSVVNVSQIITLDRSQLTKKVGRLPAGVMRSVEDGLRLAVDL
jgi:mRNA interferase MazF